MPCEGPATLGLHRDNDNAVGMLGRMNAKLPMHTELAGRKLQFREWSGEPDETQCRKDNKYPIQPTEVEGEELEDYNELSLAVRKKRDEISSMHKVSSMSRSIQPNQGQNHTQ
eukprot:6208689-Amphidinium_carterae.4